MSTEYRRAGSLLPNDTVAIYGEPPVTVSSVSLMYDGNRVLIRFKDAHPVMLPVFFPTPLMGTA